MEITIWDAVDGGIIEDSFLLGFSGFKDTNLGASSNLTCRYPSSTYQESIVFKVDLSSFGNIAVSTAYMSLNVTNTGADSPITINSHEILPIWEEFQVTWNSSKTGVSWDTAGAKGNGIDRVAVADNTDTFTGSEWDRHFTVSNSLAESSAGGWLNLLLEAPNLIADKVLRIDSSEAVVSSNRPYFYMEYTEAAPTGGIPRNRIINLGGI
ncbi:DNRLRE domain-containing protein [Candidatus Pacearchaeota archaeon]|nr:DNRLRE domain-containing protein [Candidatus Pacearchaeota archaeon]